MITLSGKFELLSKADTPDSYISLITHNKDLPKVLRREATLILDDVISPNKYPGFQSYITFSGCNQPIETNEYELIQLRNEFNYLLNGDIVRIAKKNNSIRTLFRKNSHHNAFLLTERCNHYCVMCSQPPRDIDDGFLVDEILQAIPLVDKGTHGISLSGGEPSLLGDRFCLLIERFKQHLPDTALHVLSNGKRFSDFSFSRKLSQIQHPDLMIGIPIYSDYAPLHNFVVQSKGAFDETLRGILNLKSLGVKVEIRFVMHRYTVPRIVEYANFIARNLTFVDQVAFMGLETIGFAKANIADLWIDPHDYMKMLEIAVATLDRAGVKVSVYNSQLCLLPPTLLKHYTHSISDWKNEFMPECANCYGQLQCAGFFSSNSLKHSRHLKPFKSFDEVRQHVLS